MNWFPLHNFTHYSLLKGFSKPHELAKICSDNNYPACGISDYKTISGCVSFYQACKKVGIKPILGCTFDNSTVYAKNKKGWNDLIEMVSCLDENSDLSNKIAKDIISRDNLILLNKPSSVSYYVQSKHAELHRILMCSELKTTLPKVQKKLRKNELPKEISSFFTKSDKCIRSDVMTKELESIYEQCEEYNILNAPMLPKFSCPNDMSEEEYLKVLAREGWRKLLINTGKVNQEESKNKYLDRFNSELQVIKDANLFGYFLIVQDIIRHIEKDMGCLTI